MDAISQNLIARQVRPKCATLIANLLISTPLSLYVIHSVTYIRNVRQFNFVSVLPMCQHFEPDSQFLRIQRHHTAMSAIPYLY